MTGCTEGFCGLRSRQKGDDLWSASSWQRNPMREDCRKGQKTVVTSLEAYMVWAASIVIVRCG